MQCPACNTGNPPFNSYCSSCGAALAPVCQQCGHENEQAARFCGACGGILDRKGRVDVPQGTRSLSSIAERKHGTVLFADIVGSTRLIADLDPEQAMERLRPSVAVMSSAVQRFEGTVMRILGDGIMAVFGAPRAQEGHALLACQAAMAIQRAFESNDPDLRVRIGLHSGELVVLREDHTQEAVPHGATIHLASRLEQMADPGTICLTGDCYRLVMSHCDARPLGQRDAKGFSRPIDTYALLGFKPAVASQQFRATNLTPFGGREYELQQLWRALQRTENGDARVVGISGAAGAGKSRLCYEFAEWCRNRFIPVLEARALLYGQATPLQPILEFLRLFLRVSPTEDEITARNRIAQHPAVVGLDLKTDLPLLYQFLGIEASSGPAARKSRARHSRLLHVVGHMVKQSGAQTSVIIIEDLHWLDIGSGEFITALVQSISGTRTMLVVNFRQSYTAPWMKQSHYEQMPLAELNFAQTTALVEKLLGRRPELRAISRRIVERCGGNPFFAEELVRSLAERGVICGESGDYRTGLTPDEDRLPATVQAVIGDRIDRLAEQEKTIIQIAAIIGKEFQLAVLEQIAGIETPQIEETLDRLNTAELIRSEFGPVDQFSFRHPLIQEVAYNAQLKSRRSSLHALVAIALENYHKPRLDEFAGLIAHHYESAGRPVEAANFAARAAVWIGSTNSAQAVQHWHKVRLLLKDQAHSPTNDMLRMRANGQIAMFGWREGMTAEEAKPFIAEALGWARKIDSSMISLLLAADGRISVASGGSADVYAARIKEGLAIENDQPNSGRTATLNALLCHAYWLGGSLKEALAANDLAARNISGLDDFGEQFLGLNVAQWMQALRGRILVRLGNSKEAERYLQEVLEIEQSLLDPAVQFIPHLAYVDLAYFRGDTSLAEEHASRIVQIAEKGRSPYLQVYALGCMGAAKTLGRDFSGGVRTLTDGLQFARTAKAALEFEPEIMASLADCHYQSGNFGQAIVVAREAIELARGRGARMAECRAAITCASALYGSHGLKGQADTRAMFARAEDLIRITGACVFSERMARERACVEIVTGTSAEQGG